MQFRTEAFRTGAIAAALLAGATGAWAQQPAAAPAASACTVTLEPQTLKPQAEPFHVQATLSQSIGDAVAAEIQEPNSGIDVSVLPGAMDGASAQASGASAKKPAKKGKKGAAAEANAAPAPASGQVVSLRLATGAAKAGDYTIALKGATGTCSGRITLEEAAATKP